MATVPRQRGQGPRGCHGVFTVVEEKRDLWLNRV